MSVRCNECGYLAMRDDDGVLREVTPSTRSNGLRIGSNGVNTHANFFCWKKSGVFPSVPASPPGPQKWQRGALIAQQILIQIDCHLWTTYWEGRTAKEHEEMSVLEQVRISANEERQRRQAERDDDQRIAERRHQDTIANARHTRRVAIGSLIVAALALLANFYSRTTFPQATPATAIAPAANPEGEVPPAIPSKAALPAPRVQPPEPKNTAPSQTPANP